MKMRFVGAAFRRPGAAIALIAGVAVTLAAQSPEPAFEVVSIKRGEAGVFPVGPEARRGGSFVATNATLERIVRFAYDLPSYRIVGGPEWVRNDRFSIEARAGRDASAEEIQRMVQTLIRDRFQLVTERTLSRQSASSSSVSPLPPPASTSAKPMTRLASRSRASS
jgi:hypothetical protein